MLHTNPLSTDTQSAISLGDMVASGAYQVILGIEAAYNAISGMFQR